MNLVNISKQRLQEMRDSGWKDSVKEASEFCEEYEIEVPDMDGVYEGGNKSKRKLEEMTNSHWFRVEVFNSVIDNQLVELNARFNEINTELLLCAACLNPSMSFHAFDKQKLLRLAEFYPNDFQSIEILALSDQLENFILDMRMNMETSDMNGLGDIAEKLVESNKITVYSLVYKLITLVLVLPVATATIERAFSAMNIVKSPRRNRMSDEWMNDNLIIYIEKDLFKQVSNKAIMIEFQKMAEQEVNRKVDRLIKL